MRTELETAFTRVTGNLEALAEAETKGLPACSWPSPVIQSKHPTSEHQQFAFHVCPGSPSLGRTQQYRFPVMSLSWT